MDSLRLAHALEPIIAESADQNDLPTKKALRVIRLLYNALATNDKNAIDAIAQAVDETREYSDAYNKKHGLHPNTSRMHDPSYG